MYRKFHTRDALALYQSRQVPHERHFRGDNEREWSRPKNPPEASEIRISNGRGTRRGCRVMTGKQAAGTLTHRKRYKSENCSFTFVSVRVRYLTGRVG
ncbi:hypothetical protein EVAR_64295_1 [Eumeta japonica]|uniref:Uncharacterized protein n=1 Tax=Eumeta variegata TaxID=151549 RepID=A0A4C1ZUB1_EUMVA|nr:hypothetical protein EVAR_64295_1 [Eumeta japonica]